MIVLLNGRECGAFPAQEQNFIEVPYIYSGLGKGKKVYLGDVVQALVELYNVGPEEYSYELEYGVYEEYDLERVCLAKEKGINYIIYGYKGINWYLALFYFINGNYEERYSFECRRDEIDGVEDYYFCGQVSLRKNGKSVLFGGEDDEVYANIKKKFFYAYRDELPDREILIKNNVLIVNFDGKWYNGSMWIDNNKFECNKWNIYDSGLSLEGKVVNETDFACLFVDQKKVPFYYIKSLDEDVVPPKSQATSLSF